MSIVAEAARTNDLSKVAAWLPLAVLPVAVGLLVADWPAWVFMWMLAGSIYAGLKWLTFADSPLARRASCGRSSAYLLLWPGMNATAFLNPQRTGDAARPREWSAALLKAGFGLWLVLGAAPLAVELSTLLAGWLGMIGVVFSVHFGLFHLLSLVWRRAGIDAPPIMQAPGRSTSLAEFWGRRWNLAFRDVAHAYVFRPLVRTTGAAGATMSVFVVSGIVHDLVISLPAGAGYGLPTLYFLIQGAGVLIERSRFGKRLGLGRGLRGRLVCAAVVVAPLFLLFHRPFIERVVLPMLAAIGAL